MMFKQSEQVTKICFFFTAAILHRYEQKSSNLRPHLSDTFPQGFQKSKKFGHWTMGSGGEKTFKRSEPIKQKFLKKCRGDFTPFLSKSCQILHHFFPLLFPKVSENQKLLDIGHWEAGAKRLLNKVKKFDGQTNKQTPI